MMKGLNQQKLAVQCGIWPLYRYDPRLIDEGQNPLSIDSKDPTIPVQDYMYNETRYRMLVQSDEARAEMLLKEVQKDNKKRIDFYRQMAAMHYNQEESDQK
jgi:pyruvate-ferredoxin/flavodoxin oxidoreductase